MKECESDYVREEYKRERVNVCGREKERLCKKEV